MSDIVEAVARAICVAEGMDPDRTSIGFGHRIPKGVEYKLWEAQREKAEAAIAAVGVEIERLRARVEGLELIRRYMGQGVSWDRAEERAIDEIEERKARAALEAKP